jgi:hypothetical protein
VPTQIVKFFAIVVSCNGGMEYWKIGMMESWIQYSSVPRFH